MKFNMKKAAALLLAGSMVAGYAVPAAAEAEEKSGILKPTTSAPRRNTPAIPTWARPAVT